MDSKVSVHLDKCPCTLTAYTSLIVYLSLGSTIITSNNTEVLITDIGEEAFGYLPSLTCHTDLTECCRNSDTGGQGGRGAWYYPDGRTLQNNEGSMAAGERFYFVRNDPQLIRLARRDAINPFSPTGFYCCVIPTTAGGMTFCAKLGQLLHISTIKIILLIGKTTHSRVSLPPPD